MMEIIFHHKTSSISRRDREKEIYHETLTTIKYPLTFLPHNPLIKTQPFLLPLASKNPKPSKDLRQQMSLPYDLYLSLFPESLILDTSLLSNGLDEFEMGYMANEEVEVRREIIHTILSGNSTSLQPNSGQPVTIRGHNICIRWHNERGSDFRAWEWHGHVMTYDEEKGYSLEYIFGDYFERIPETHQ